MLLAERRSGASAGVTPIEMGTLEAASVHRRPSIGADDARSGARMYC